MSETPKLTPISEYGEFGLIDHLTKKFHSQNEETLKGVGDDAAVLKSGDGLQLLSTDLLVEAIHFDLTYFPLKHLGYKSVVVNLSDIYAMNGTPKQFTFSLALSSRFTVEALEEIYAGIEQACRFYNVDLVGGDTTSSVNGLFIAVSVIGEAEEKKVCYRSGAQEGDVICTTGHLGAAYLGLQIMEREKSVFMEAPGMQPELENYQYLIGRFLKPEARKDVIQLFETKEVVPTSMIDISDGLSSELMHICKQSEVGANIIESRLPIHPEVQRVADEFKIPANTCLLNGGEDYELLFTLSPDDFENVKGLLDIVKIGTIVSKSEGITLQTADEKKHPLKAQGWQHFS